MINVQRLDELRVSGADCVPSAAVPIPDEVLAKFRSVRDDTPMGSYNIHDYTAAWDALNWICTSDDGVNFLGAARLATALNEAIDESAAIDGTDVLGAWNDLDEELRHNMAIFASAARSHMVTVNFTGGSYSPCSVSEIFSVEDLSYSLVYPDAELVLSSEVVYADYHSAAIRQSESTTVYWVSEGVSHSEIAHEDAHDYGDFVYCDRSSAYYYGDVNTAYLGSSNEDNVVLCDETDRGTIVIDVDGESHWFADREEARRYERAQMDEDDEDDEEDEDEYENDTSINSDFVFRKHMSDYHRGPRDYGLFGNDQRFVGIEIEVEYGSRGSAARALQNAAEAASTSLAKRAIIFERDGSLATGRSFEAVCMPATIDSPLMYSDDGFVAQFLRAANEPGRDTAHEEDSAGMHVNLSQTFFDPGPKHALRFAEFFDTQHAIVDAIARRARTSYCLAHKSRADRISEVMERTKYRGVRFRQPFNSASSIAEVRVFRTPYTIEQVRQAIQLSAAVADFTRGYFAMWDLLGVRSAFRSFIGKYSATYPDLCRALRITGEGQRYEPPSVPARYVERAPGLHFLHADDIAWTRKVAKEREQERLRAMKFGPAFVNMQASALVRGRHPSVKVLFGSPSFF